MYLPTCLPTYLPARLPPPAPTHPHPGTLKQDLQPYESWADLAHGDQQSRPGTTTPTTGSQCTGTFVKLAVDLQSMKEEHAHAGDLEGEHVEEGTEESSEWKLVISSISAFPTIAPLLSHPEPDITLLSFQLPADYQPRQSVMSIRFSAVLLLHDEAYRNASLMRYIQDTLSNIDQPKVFLEDDSLLPGDKANM